LFLTDVPGNLNLVEALGQERGGGTARLRRLGNSSVKCGVSPGGLTGYEEESLAPFGPTGFAGGMEEIRKIDPVPESVPRRAGRE